MSGLVILKFKEVKEGCVESLRDAASSAGYTVKEIEISETPDPSLGDISSPLPIRIARMEKKQIREISSELLKHINENLPRYIKRAEAHERGYINFWIDFPRFASDGLGEIISSNLEGIINIGKGKRVSIEHTAVNPNKALHIGHARNLVIGDCLARILRYTSHQVNVLNYIDDSGAQVADLIVGFKFLGIPENSQKKFDQYCGDEVYTKVNSMYEKKPELREKQAYVLREIEKGDTEIARYTQEIVKRVLAEQLKTCWRLGASYDLLNWETHILHSGMWENIFKIMKDKGIVRYVTEGENKGCWVMREETGEEKVLVRSDGTAVYVAKDIPYAAWKLGLVNDPFRYVVYANQPDGSALYSTSLSEGIKLDFSSETAITVIDTRQSYLQQIIISVLDRLFPSSKRNYIHRGYEVVSLSKRTAETLGIHSSSEIVHMSGRRGTYINVDVLVDELKKRAILETSKRNPSEKEEWIEKVSESIAISAIRYELAKQDPEKMIVFDLASSLMLQGETGPYLLYTYARACRILEKANESHSLDTRGFEMMKEDSEIQLIKKLTSFDISVTRAVEFLSPSEVAHYALSICDIFNLFYERTTVIHEEKEELRRARIGLVLAFKIVLGKCLDLLGIPKEERI
jgi:arginyl-tRNA synthetase